MPRHRRLSPPATLLALSLALAAAPRAANLPEVPDALKVPAGQTLTLELNATGVQIYTCRPRKDDAAAFEWTLLAPEAELVDAAGKKMGKHYAGPTWEAADGSKVVGELKARDAGPDPKAIPWLLLSAKSTAGSGVLSKTASIQRLRTVGGVAPGDGCKQAADAGKETRVPYQAVYDFYAVKP
jgi:hypothetical protein